ncbi:hypothetical protein LIER_32471 [Lithospermum erythrorhizon]|uniref:Uncharacterized protein n=1 Tax=Lithospermum erythrorhizon TaxID=34254 RepID=A0AAV3RVP8_LITER
MYFTFCVIQVMVRGSHYSLVTGDLPSGSVGRPGYGDPNENSLSEPSQIKYSVKNKGTSGENSNQSKQNSGIGPMNETRQKCKKVCHLAHCCPVGGLPDAATSKSSREVTSGSNDLKAAIEAAKLRKSGIWRKSRVADHSSDSSKSSKNGDTVSQDHYVGPVNKKKHASLDNVHTSTSGTGDGGLVVPYDGNASIRDLLFWIPIPIYVPCKTTAIPEHEFTWQYGLFLFYFSTLPPPLSLTSLAIFRFTLSELIETDKINVEAQGRILDSNPLTPLQSSSVKVLLKLDAPTVA